MSKINPFYLKRRGFQTGFTLIEFLIYLGIVSGILIMIFGFGWQIILGNIKSQAIREVQQNTRFALEKISRTVLAASAINSPAAALTGASLSLTMRDIALNPTIFDVADGRLRIRQAGKGPYELTSDRVRVANLQFINISYGASAGVRVQMTLKYFNPNNLREYEASFEMEETTSLR